MNLTTRLYLVWRVRRAVSNPHPVAFVLRIRTDFSFAVRVQDPDLREVKKFLQLNHRY